MQRISFGGFFSLGGGFMGSSNPTHTVFSASISHLNVERLFGEELHIGPMALNPPIEY